ncbi:MAG TPA: hypothetical protein DGT21_12555 [Armatimonadetes bacterium]|jgi:hypothetical protein|nr:hypothetical protein [Armatimonadota bacterium]
MRTCYLRISVLLAALCAVGVAARAADTIRREDLGRTVKLKIVVDKVMQKHAGWKTEEWMVKAAAEAGFNVYSPRVGHEDLRDVRRVANWARRYGIYYMPWMRGSLTAPSGPEADGKRVLWASGSEQPLWSVNSDEFWAWTTQYIVEYARMSKGNRALMGVFLDYENYSSGGHGNLYALSYDDVIMGKFAESRGIELPQLDRDKRKPWLDEQGLHEEFEQFQVNHWRERCRALREAVDEQDPTFQFCVYPAPGTPFMVQAIYYEWSTKQAPIILADPYVYGRPSRFCPHADAIVGNRDTLLRNRKIADDAGIAYIYAGGIDPAVQGADAEFSGKNAVAISDVTDGYWIFYEGPEYTTTHADYWKWFTWANTQIDARNWQAQYEPRETPEDWGLDVFDQVAGGPSIMPLQSSDQVVEYPTVTMRRDNLMVLAAKAGQTVEVSLRNHPVAKYTSMLVWFVKDSGMNAVAEGQIENDQSGVVTFTPAADGIYLLGASAGSCAFSVDKSNVPLSLYARSGTSFIHGAQRLYFAVPQSSRQFKLSATGSGGETVRLNVYDPDGNLVASEQTTPSTTTVSLTVPAGEHAGKTWSAALVKADVGVLEDCSLKVGDGLPPTVSLSPEHVFGMVEQQ